MDLEQFSKLETSVYQLTKRYKSLKEEKESLEGELRAARKRAEELEVELGKIKNTRREVLRKVDVLIRQLEAENKRTRRLPR